MLSVFCNEVKPKSAWSSSQWADQTMYGDRSQWVFGCRSCNESGVIWTDRALFHSKRCRYHQGFMNDAVQASVKSTLYAGNYEVRHLAWHNTEESKELDFCHRTLGQWATTCLARVDVRYPSLTPTGTVTGRLTVIVLGILSNVQYDIVVRYMLS